MNNTGINSLIPSFEELTHATTNIVLMTEDRKSVV